MRAAVLCLLAVGCGKPAALPVPKADNYTTRLAANDLITHNVFGPRNHVAEGKRVLVLVPPAFAHMTTDGEGKPCVLFDSNNGFSRPLAVFRLNADSIFAEGKTLLPTDRIEADFVGHVDDKAKWFAPWASMERHNSRGQIILFQNGRIVTE